MGKLRRVSIVLALTAVASLGAACGDDEGDSGAQAQSTTVQAFDFYFEPTSLQFEPGAEVTLTLENVGEVAHSITIPDLDFEADAGGGDTVENTVTMPDEAGTFDFYCKYHPDDMTGTLSLGGADQPIEEDVDEEDDEDVEVDVDSEDEDADASAEDDPDY